MTTYSGAELNEIPPVRPDIDLTATKLFSDSSSPSSPFSRSQNDSTANAFLPSVEIGNVIHEVATREETSEQVETADGKEEMKKLAADITKAVVSGKPEDISAVMRTAYTACGGDKTKVAALGAELSSQLSDKGFDVKYGGDNKSISIHKHGSDKAVSFDLADWSRAGHSPYREQAYDWVTKKDIDVKPETVLSDFGKPGDSNGLKDANELAKMLETARKSGDFTEVNRELLRSAKHAHAARGDAGVSDFEAALRKADKSENSPLLVVSGDKLTLYQGKVLTPDEAAAALEGGGLKQAGIIKDSRGRYLKPTGRGTDIDLPKKK